MCFEDIEEMMSRAKYDDYGNHELLVSLSCVFECTSRHDGGEYQTEVLFAVPVKSVWIYLQSQTGWETLSEKAKNGWKDFNLERIQDWLNNEYTSEDSQSILERAIKENKVAFWKIN